MDTQITVKRDERTILPPDDLEQMLDVSQFLERSGAHALLLGPDGEQVELPTEVYRVLLGVVDSMMKRQAITVVPLDQKMTTQTAADFLGISRPTLIKLLESGDIPYEKVPGSRHRRVLLTDVLNYQKRLQDKRMKLFAQMAADAEEDGLYN